PEAGEAAVSEVMSSRTGSTSLIGLFVLVWASLQLFRSFDIAFTEIYHEEYDETLIEEIESAFLALVILAISVALIVSTGSVIAAFPQSPSLGLVWAVLTFLALTLVFLPLYYVFTDVDLSLRELLPGALVAAAGWTLLQSGFSVYTGQFGGSIYGVFGGVLLLVLWMYLGNMLILLGAVVNYVGWEKR
ncbi:MAG: YihY/virulence factor BrkB family protein, partial [Candidatus Nanohaloarchaea archaeon]|nr:YihY/virulence factor BrkB family protein [Candidatus Nanohaloarchaea archaeon]